MSVSSLDSLGLFNTTVFVTSPMNLYTCSEVLKVMVSWSEESSDEEDVDLYFLLFPLWSRFSNVVFNLLKNLHNKISRL